MNGVAVSRLDVQAPTGEGPKLSLECSFCGYGIAAAPPPERCPMCHGVAAWNHTLWRPFSARRCV
jgi:rubrerythrin